jgi:hypothetical protein
VKPVTKLLVGIGAMLPLVSAIGVAFYIAFQLISFDLAQPGGPSGDLFGAIDQVFDLSDAAAFAVTTCLIALFEMIFAVVLSVHAAKNPRLIGGARVAWILALLFVSPFSFPTYFVLYVLREPIPRRIADLHQAPIAT